MVRDSDSETLRGHDILTESTMEALKQLYTWGRERQIDTYTQTYTRANSGSSVKRGTPSTLE